jgi:cell wall-associated NlpC family hydrolase
VTYLSLIGAPYERGASGPGKFDCYGLVKFLTLRDTGRSVPDYETPEDQERVAAVIACSSLFWKRLDTPKPGCVVMFRIGRLTSHVGYVIEQGKFIHAWERSGGVAIERLSDWDRNKRIVGFYEYVA